MTATELRRLNELVEENRNLKRLLREAVEKLAATTQH